MTSSKVWVHPSTINRLQNTQAAVSGLARLIEKATMEDTRPDWWTGYHDGVLVAALRECASNVDEVIDVLADARDRQADPDRNADGVHLDPRVQFREREEAEAAAK